MLTQHSTMNYTKIEKELNSIPTKIVHQYFTERTAIPGAKIHLLNKLKKFPEMKAVQPISYTYFKNNFSHLCANYPELMISIVKVGKEEPDHLVHDLKKVSINKAIEWDNLMISTIASAETLFQNAQKEIRDIVLNNVKLRKRITKVLKNIEPLAGAEPYNDIRRIYWMLYCELRIVLQFHKPDPNWNFSFTIGEHPEHWFKLRGEKDVPALRYLSEHSIEEYEKKPDDFKDGLLSAVKGDCVSEAPPSSPPDIDEPKPHDMESDTLTHETPIDLTDFHSITLDPNNPILSNDKSKVTLTGKNKKVSFKLTQVQSSFLDFLIQERSRNEKHWLADRDKRKNVLLEIINRYILPDQYEDELDVDSNKKNDTWISDNINYYRKTLVSDINNKLKDKYDDVKGNIIVLIKVPHKTGVYSIAKHFTEAVIKKGI